MVEQSGVVAWFWCSNPGPASLVHMVSFAVNKHRIVLTGCEPFTCLDGTTSFARVSLYIFQDYEDLPQDSDKSRRTTPWWTLASGVGGWTGGTSSVHVRTMRIPRWHQLGQPLLSINEVPYALFIAIKTGGLGRVRRTVFGTFRQGSEQRRGMLS